MHNFIALAKHRTFASADTTFIFCGDGVSDISAARNADVLFARNGRDLEKYCEKHDIPFIGFDTFQAVADLADGSLFFKRMKKRAFPELFQLLKYF